MKSKFRILSLSPMLLLTVAANPASGQGTTFFQHSGYANPTNEGFNFSGLGGGAQVGAVTNDLGQNAWFIAPTSSFIPWYSQSMTSQEQSQALGSDTLVNLSLRLVGSAYANIDYSTGLKSFQMEVYNGSGNDLWVQIQYSKYLLVNSASAYNNFQIIYDPALDAANLLVNGVARITGVAGFSGTPGPANLFLDVNSGQANWSLASMGVTPEPSSTLLVFLGGGVLIYVCQRNRRSARVK
jgi:hypothetical protein